MHRSCRCALRGSLLPLSDGLYRLSPAPSNPRASWSSNSAGSFQKNPICASSSGLQRLGLPGFRKIKGSRWENIGEMVERAVGPDSPEEGDEASLRSLPLVPAETPMKKTVNSFLLGQTGPLTSFLVFFFSLLVEPWSCMKKKNASILIKGEDTSILCLLRWCS